MTEGSGFSFSSFIVAAATTPPGRSRGFLSRLTGSRHTGWQVDDIVPAQLAS